MAIAAEGSSFVNVVMDGDDLYATTVGEVFSLDPASGAIRWKNNLPGFGHGLITVATSASQQAITLHEKNRQDEAASAAAIAAATSS